VYSEAYLEGHLCSSCFGRFPDSRGCLPSDLYCFRVFSKHEKYTKDDENMKPFFFCVTMHKKCEIRYPGM
jgi:hypothetical protein